MAIATGSRLHNGHIARLPASLPGAFLHVGPETLDERLQRKSAGGAEERSLSEDASARLMCMLALGALP